MKQKNKHMMPPVKGQIIEVTERHISDSVQGMVKVGGRYVVTDTDILTDGTPVAIVAKPSGKGTMRINAARFSWKTINAEELIAGVRSKALERDIDVTQMKLKERFSDDEVNRMLFIPYVIESMAVEYLSRCVAYAREQRVPWLNKVSRNARMVIEQIREDKFREIGEAAYNDLKADGDGFLQDNTLQFTRLWFTINNMLKALGADDRHMTMVTDALCGLTLIDILEKFYVDRDKEIVKMFSRRIFSNHLDRKFNIKTLLNSYAGDILKIFNRNDMSLTLAKKIIMNKLNEVVFLPK